MNRISPDLRATLLLTAAFWVVTLIVISLRSALMGDAVGFVEYIPRRLGIALFGALLCYGSSHVLPALRHRSILVQGVAGLGLATLMSMAQSGFHMLIYHVIERLPNSPPVTLNSFGQWTIFWFGYFLAWTGIYLALLHHRTTRLQERRIAAINSMARDAQLAALRHQINPHFLFNTLNSISALVLTAKREDAERMLMNLSDFLRATLGSDHNGSVSLKDEIGLQELYLRIEEVRFSDRMTVRISIPPDLLEARVPPLILQPLVENAVRHGVACSEERTSISIEAAREGNRLLVSVCDDARSTRAARPGTRLGLANVRARLAAQYGSEAELLAAPREGAGFMATISLPLSFSKRGKRAG